MGIERVVDAVHVQGPTEAEEIGDHELAIVSEPVVEGAEVVAARGEPVQQDDHPVAVAEGPHRQTASAAVRAAAAAP